MFCIYILTIYPECVLFQLFSRVMNMHIPILTMVQKEHITIKKWSYFVKKCAFET